MGNNGERQVLLAMINSSKQLAAERHERGIHAAGRVC
jgi:hypothetical protein